MHFGPFRFDDENECLWRGEETITLTPKAFAVLRYFVTHPGRLVTKEELLKAVWPKTYVTDAVLKVCIGEIRRVLTDDAKAPQFIETVHRRGYRFIAPLSAPPLVVSSQYSVASSREQSAVRSPQSGGEDFQSAIRNPQSIMSLVGREAELRRLHELLEQALRGERRIVFVTGESGMGKTALIEAFLSGIGQQGTGNRQRGTGNRKQGTSNSSQTSDLGPRTSDVRSSIPGPRSPTPSLWIARGQCLEHYGAGEPYLPILEAVGRLGREAGRERLLSILDRYAPTWLAQMPALVDLEDRQRLQRETLNATPERMLREMSEAVEALTAEMPLVLVLEDLHWSDYSTLDLLSALARRREPARLLLIGAYRPAEVDMSGHPLRNVKQELLAHGLCEEMELESLGAEEVGAYLAERFAGGAATAELAPVIYKQTGGLPLFMVNAVEHLLSQGVVALQNNAWRVTGRIDEIEITAPEGLQQLIVQRVERLNLPEQRALEAASLVGGEFSAAVAAVALQTDLTAIEEVCDRLVQRGQFLRAGGVKEEPNGTVSACYHFTHALYQQALTERVGMARRLRLQQRIGEWVEAVYGDRAKEVAAELAMRFERSRDYTRAVRYLQSAGEGAMRKHAPREAADYFTKGLRLLKLLPDSPDRARQELLLQMARGPALMAIQGYAAHEVEQAYLRARELCQQIGDSSRLFPVLWGLWLFYLVRAEFPAARALGEQLLEFARNAQDPTLLLQAHNALGTTLYHLGEFAAAREQLTLGAAVYRADQHHFLALLYGGEDPGVVCSCLSALALWMLGYPEQAERRIREALTLARQLRHPFSLAAALGFAAAFYQYCRQAPATLERAEELIATAEAEGFPYWSASGAILRGWALSGQGRQEEGIELIRQGLETHRLAGTELFRPYWLALLAEAYGKGGHGGAGLQVLQEACSLMSHSGERVYEAELYRLRGELLLARIPAGA